MKFRLLGRVAVTPLAAPQPQLRPQVIEFLAALLLSPEFTADSNIIRSYLWPGSQTGKDNGIQQCVSQLRAVLGHDIVRRVGPGTYRLVVEPEDVDLHCFERLLETARGATGAERAEQFWQSVNLWSGPPLANVGGGRFDGIRDDLVELWRAACVDYITAECEVGALANIETRLPGIVQAWSKHNRYAPMAVGLWDMYAKQKANSKQALVDSPHQTVPRQLPAHRTNIVGRDLVLASIDAALIQGDGPRICILSGPAGVGKSVVALRWAETRSEHFPDGVLYVDLHGFSKHPAMGSEQVLTRFLNDLEVEIPRTRDGLSTAFRTALAERAVLVILDNARDVRQVRPMLPGPGASAVMVTSRNQLVGLAAVEGAPRVCVPKLHADDCAVLLASLIGRTRMESELDSAHELLRHCVGLPLAVIVLGSRVAARNVLTLSDIVAELRSAANRLSSFVHDEAELNLRAVFESALAQLSPRATTLFWKLGVHRGPSISREAVGVLSALADSDWQEALAELRSAHIVEEVSYERYTMHDLLRAFAEERAGDESAAERRVVIERVLDHLVHNARACDRVISPVREVAMGQRPPGIPVVAPAGPQAAMDWFDAEYEVITAAVDQAESLGMDRYTWLLPVVVSTYQWRRGRFLDAGKMLESAFQAAERVADPGDIAMVLRLRAGTDRGLARPDHAKIRLADAIALCDHGADPLGYAHSSNALAVIHRENGEPDLAERRFTDALAIYRDHGDAAGATVSLNGIGCVFFDRGDLDKALAFCEEALEAARASPDENGRANVFDSLAGIKFARREYGIAVDHYQSALEIFSRLDYKQNEAQTLCRLADGWEALGDRSKARSALVRAVELFEEISHPAAAEVTARLRTLK